MKSQINQLRSKVMKAAWTIWRKRDCSSWSNAVAKAWAWAKKGLQKVVDISSVICGETAKAYKVGVIVFCVHTELEKRGFAFIPKSMVVNGCIPQWFAAKKLDEAKEYMVGSYPAKCLFA